MLLRILYFIILSKSCIYEIAYDNPIVQVILQSTETKDTKAENNNIEPNRRNIETSNINKNIKKVRSASSQ